MQATSRAPPFYACIEFRLVPADTSHVSPISLKRGLYAGALIAAVSLLAAAFVGMILLARSLEAGHSDTSGAAVFAIAGFVFASLLGAGASNLILVRPGGHVSRARVAAAAVALTAIVPLCAVLALFIGPHFVGRTGLLFGVSVPTAAIVTLAVYVWARTAIPWVNRSAVTA
jgi:hypothetical protein